jgi:hypothetical protein
MFSLNLFGSLRSHIEIIVLALRESKTCAFLSTSCALAYGGTILIEGKYIDHLHTAWSEYHKLFSVQFGQFEEAAKSVSESGLTNALHSTTNLASIETLYSSIYSGIGAATGYIAIHVFKNLPIQILIQTLTYTLTKALIRKWLGNGINNQLGLQITDSETARETDIIIATRTEEYVRCLIERTSMYVEIGLALIKAKNLYHLGLTLAAQGLPANFFLGIGASVAIYLIVNYTLSHFIKRYADDLSNTKKRFAQDLAFNMHNPLQIDASQATKKEYEALTLLNKDMYTVLIKNTLFKEAVDTCSAVLTHKADFLNTMACITDVDG